MSNLTSDQANQLANNFLAIARVVGDYRFSNWKHLSQEQKDKLGAFQDSLLDAGEDMLAQSVSLLMNEVAASLKTIQDVTDKIQTTVHKLKNIQVAIDVAAAAVSLSAAILRKDPQGIASAIKVFGETTKTEKG